MFGLFVYWKNQQNIEFWVFLSFIIIIFDIFFLFCLVHEFKFLKIWRRIETKKNKKVRESDELTQKIRSYDVI